MKKFFATLVGICLFLGCGFTVDQDLKSKFLFIDMQKAILSVGDGLDAKKTLETEKKEKQQLVNVMNTEFKTSQSQFKLVSSKLSKAKREEGAKNLQKKLQLIQMQVQGMNKDLIEKERATLKKISDGIQGIVDEVAIQRDAYLVFNTSGGEVVYKLGEDITNEVILRYDKKYAPAKPQKEEKEAPETTEKAPE